MLDLFCGTGESTRTLASLPENEGNIVLGVDRSIERLSRGRDGMDIDDRVCVGENGIERKGMERRGPKAKESEASCES